MHQPLPRHGAPTATAAAASATMRPFTTAAAVSGSELRTGHLAAQSVPAAARRSMHRPTTPMVREKCTQYTQQCVEKTFESAIISVKGGAAPSGLVTLKRKSSFIVENN